MDNNSRKLALEGWGMTPANSTISLPTRSRRGETVQSALRSVVGHGLIAIAAITAPLTYCSSFESRNTQSVCLRYNWSRRRGKKITRREARRIAIQIYVQATENIRREHQADADEFARLWNADDPL